MKYTKSYIFLCISQGGIKLYLFLYIINLLACQFISCEDIAHFVFDYA